MVARFLDEHFYLPPLFDSAIRVSDKNEQMLGKDIIVSSSRLGLSNAIIDEKDTAHYVNKNIPTFAFELSFLLYDRTEVEGWLTDRAKETEYYLLLWPFAKLVEPVSKPPEFKEITKLRYSLVKREDVINLLLAKGFDRKALLEKAREMRSTVKGYADNQNLKAIDKERYGFYFMYTYFLAEKPVNVVIPREQLEKIAIVSGFCEKPL
jgi:hypothetical protein